MGRRKGVQYAPVLTDEEREIAAWRKAMGRWQSPASPSPPSEEEEEGEEGGGGEDAVRGWRVVVERAVKRAKTRSGRPWPKLAHKSAPKGFARRPLEWWEKQVRRDQKVELMLRNERIRLLEAREAVEAALLRNMADLERVREVLTRGISDPVREVTRRAESDQTPPD
jgi:hypothetical protein